MGLKLRRNRHLVAPSFRVVVRDGQAEADEAADEVVAEGRRLQKDVPLCHFLHRGDGSGDGMVAALSLCHPDSVVTPPDILSSFYKSAVNNKKCIKKFF